MGAMRRRLMIGLAAGMAMRAFCAEPVTVAQLEQVLVVSHAASDAQMATRLSEMQLTERLDSATLARLIDGLHGEKSTQALTVVADMSAFLAAPAAEIPAEANPDAGRQRQIMAKAVDYVMRMNHLLPNFFATRKTTRFEDWPKDLFVKDEVPARHISPRMVDVSSATVRYREGKEEVSATAGRHKKAEASGQGLFSYGLFGPILSTVLVDASRGTAVWSHWERGATKTLAVFRYTVPMEKSNYQVKFCCVPVGGMVLSLLNRVSAYHGEITVDPDDGTIVRLTLQADLDQGDLPTLLQEAGEDMPLSRADVMVEYGPVDIGGKTYYCPTRSVAVSKARAVLVSGDDKAARLGPTKIFVNDAAFTQYHVFRSESRILLDGSQ
jgi:hypothetical protein